MSGKIILEARVEVRRRKEGICQEDTVIKGVQLRNGFCLDTGEPPAISFCAHV